MKDHKLSQLFRAARREAPPTPGPGFANLVLAEIHRQPPPPVRAPVSLLDQLGALFPRVAAVAVLVLVVCLTLEWRLSASAPGDLTDSLTELSEQWFFSAN